MTGTGTKDDPYIVDNWADYQTVYGSETYIEWCSTTENKVVDFNEIKPDGFTDSVRFSPYTTFNGWTFKNFFSTKTTAPLHFGSRSGTIEGLTFVNFYWQPKSDTSTGYFLYANTSGDMNFKNCTFSGQIQVADGAKYFTGTTCEFNESSLNIIVSSPKDFIIFGSGVKNSDIVADISAPTVTLCKNSAVNSRFSGKIRSDANVSAGNANSAYNVFNIQSNQPVNYLGKGISVYNSDISTSAQSDEDMKSLGIDFKGCTAEQLRDAQYLYNLRFPIGVG